MQKVTENIYSKTTFQGCNSSFIVTKEGSVIVDTPMVPVEAQEWKREVELRAPVKYVIINEAHTDHYCGSCYLEGTVIGTEDTYHALKNARIEDFINNLSRMAPDSPGPDLSFYFKPPEICIDGETILHLGEHTVKIFPAPGHTPKQLAVYVPEERVLFTSDNINLNIPIFFDALPYEWLKTLDMLSGLDIDHVIPGHGEVTDKSAFGKMKGKIQMWIDFISAAINEGLDIEGARKKAMEAKEFAEIPKEGPMAEFFNINVESLYRALAE